MRNVHAFVTKHLLVNCNGLLEIYSYSVRHQTGSRVVGLSTSSMRAALGDQRGEKRRGKEGGNKNSGCTVWDVTALCREAGLVEALESLNVMYQQGIRIDSDTFARLLQACGNKKALAEGKRVHAHIIKCGLDGDIFLANNLVTMYAKCGNLLDAHQVFDKMPKRNVYSWTAMIAGLSQHGHDEAAFKLFCRMENEGVKPNKVTSVSVLNSCESPAALSKGKLVHAYIVASGSESDVIVGTALVRMYSRCAGIEDARRVFDKMCTRDVISWTVIIRACAQSGDCKETLELFYQMQQEGMKPNKFTFSSILSACASPAYLAQGKQVHDLIIKSGFESDVFVSNALVDMYIKGGSIEDARRVFDMMPTRDLVSWNVMIAGFVWHGHRDAALEFLEQMQTEGMEPDRFTISSVLNACASLGQGKRVHAQILQSGFKLDVFVGAALVDMYARCGSIEDARKAFDAMPKRDAVLWTVMLSGYIQHRCVKEALEVFQQMQCEGFQPDVSIENAMVDMYFKCGSIDDAHQMFHKMHTRDVGSWNAMIAGLVQDGRDEIALELFQQMQREGTKPDKFTFSSILKVCASLAALEQGKRVHVYIIKDGYDSDVFVGAALVDMYAKCGSLEDARQVFDNLAERDVVSWTAMIAGYAQHGLGKEAIELFHQMQQEGVKPDGLTFSSLLSACSRAGMIDEGCHYFDSMSREHSITAKAEHYAGMVDLLVRAGRLDEAEDFIHKMPLEPNIRVWMSLLGACRSHGNVKLAERAAEHVFKLEPQNAAAYVLLSNVYAATGRWDDQDKLRKLMKYRRVKKEPGQSWIEVQGRVHVFSAKDKSHQQTKEIYAELESFIGQMEVGYVPAMNFELSAMEQDQKKGFLCYHSEKLAIAFGLISIPPGMPLRIVKSLPVCSDCHTITKHISKIVGRDIVVRDAKCFHHFKHGVCSCRDYW